MIITVTLPPKNFRIFPFPFLSIPNILCQSKLFVINKSVGIQGCRKTLLALKHGRVFGVFLHCFGQMGKLSNYASSRNSSRGRFLDLHVYPPIISKLSMCMKATDFCPKRTNLFFSNGSIRFQQSHPPKPCGIFSTFRLSKSYTKRGIHIFSSFSSKVVSENEQKPSYLIKILMFLVSFTLFFGQILILSNYTFS